MTPAFKPRTVQELADYVAIGAKLEIVGRGTKRGLGRPLQAETALDMSGFTGISLYEPEELVLEAGAGTPLSEIERALAKNHQQLAFEPPDYSKLLGVHHRGTLGGLMACGLSGPRRIKAGAARDHILGLAGVSGRGEIFKAGGRVVKNVTGFDVAKLMTGSYGTLAALTSITVKVLPAAQTEETLVFNGLSDARAVQAMSLAMQSACEVSGAAHLPGIPAKTLFRLEGIQPSVRLPPPEACQPPENFRGERSSRRKGIARRVEGHPRCRAAERRRRPLCLEAVAHAFEGGRNRGADFKAA